MPTSLDVYLPFDAGAGANITEDQWRKMARFWIDSGPIRGEDNEMQVIADSTGMQVKVKTGKAFVRGHYGEVTAQRTLPVTAAHATLARIDRVVLRADFTNNKIELDVLAGTAAGSPVAPALTQSTSKWEISLATVSVPATDTSIDAGQVTDERVLIRPGSTTGGLLAPPVDITTNQIVANSAADFFIASISVFVPAGHRVRVSFETAAMSADTAGAQAEVRIKDGATQVCGATATIAAINALVPLSISRRLIPSAGLHTFNLYLSKPGGGGTSGFLASATTPAEFAVEDLGITPP